MVDRFQEPGVGDSVRGGQIGKPRSGHRSQGRLTHGKRPGIVGTGLGRGQDGAVSSAAEKGPGDENADHRLKSHAGKLSRRGAVRQGAITRPTKGWLGLSEAKPQASR